MAPPLVGDFMGRYFLHEAGELVVDRSEKHPSLCRVGVGRDREINQVRPGLPKIKIRLLGDVDFFIRTLPEVDAAYLQLSAGLFESIFCHPAGRHGLQRGILPQAVGQLTEVETRYLVAGYLIRQVEPFVFAVVESGHCDWNWRYPMARGQVLLNRLSLEPTDADDLVFPRDFESKIIEGPFAKSIQVRIPGGARTDVETPLSSFFQDLIACILDIDRLFLAK